MKSFKKRRVPREKHPRKGKFFACRFRDKIFIFFCLLILFLSTFAPRFINGEINRALGKTFGEGEVVAVFKLRELNSKARASLFLFDKNGVPIVLIPELSVPDFVTSVLRGRADLINVSGVSVFLENIPAFPESENKTDETPLSLKPLAAFANRFRKIGIDGNVFLPVGDGTTFAMPFDINVRSRNRVFNVRAETSVGGAGIVALTTVDYENDTIDLQISGSIFAGTLPGFIGVPPEAAGISLTDILGNAAVNLAETTFSGKTFAELSVPVPFGETVVLHPTLSVESDVAGGASLSLSVGENESSATNAPDLSIGDFSISGFNAILKCSLAPNSPPQISGEISADVFHKETRLAQIGGALSQTNGVFKFTAELDGPALAARAVIGASFDPATKKTEAVFSLPSQRFDQTILPKLPLGDLAADFADGPEFAGLLQADGKFAIENGKQSGEFKAGVRELTLNWPEKEIFATNIFAALSFPELPNISNNSLALGFKDFRAGEIELDSAFSRLRFLPPDSLFMDNLALEWCDGKIRAESTRFSLSNQSVRVVLHGDRIRLSKLLGQLGVGQDSGQAGYLSGMIPVNISREKITFRDAYLYSTPGIEGSVKLTPSEQIAQTASAVTETALVVDALSDYTYQWLRLGLDTKGDDLLIRLEMDGKPSSNLFYTVDAGGITKSLTANKFQGLALDVNFSLPLNRILPFVKDPASLLAD